MFKIKCFFSRKEIMHRYKVTLAKIINKNNDKIALKTTPDSGFIKFIKIYKVITQSSNDNIQRQVHY